MELKCEIHNFNYINCLFFELQDSYHYNLTGVRVVVLCPGVLQSDSSTHENRFKSPTHEKAWQLDMKGVHPQK